MSDHWLCAGPCEDGKTCWCGTICGEMFVRTLRREEPALSERDARRLIAEAMIREAVEVLSAEDETLGKYPLITDRRITQQIALQDHLLRVATAGAGRINTENKA